MILGIKTFFGGVFGKRKSEDIIEESPNNKQPKESTNMSSIRHHDDGTLIQAFSSSRAPVNEFAEGERTLATSFICRTIHIGTYKFDLKERVVITSRGIRIVAPSVKNVKELIVLNIQKTEIVKIVVSEELDVIFLFTTPACARYITAQLTMAPSSDESPFYSPISRNETQKKIVFLLQSSENGTKSILEKLYISMILEEINDREADEMLLRATGTPLIIQATTATPRNTMNGTTAQETDNRRLFIYPQGRGGIAVNSSDYMCLATDVYLNDVIIDFYLQYLFHEILSDEQRAKTHIFSQFFYTRLTTSTNEEDRQLTTAQNRHNRVESWSKSLNLFEKDFIIIPINERAHWFLAIICFANLTEPHTMDTNQPIKLIPVQKRASKLPLSKKQDAFDTDDEEQSERDDAEVEEFDLDYLESEGEEVVDRGQAVKVPCILIFDSLCNSSRSRVVATLRDYLTWEYKAKFPNLPPRLYTKSNMQGHKAKVPQQENLTDCGLFLLQYVEHFFEEPIRDFRLPLESLVNWFDPDIVTVHKREEIAQLIAFLIKRTSSAGIELPTIDFPSSLHF